MHRKPASNSRGLSIPEILIAMMIGTSAIGLVVSLCKPMLLAQHSEQASMAEIQVMDSTLYRLQRDVRQSDPNGIFLCSSASQAFSCNQASAYSTPTDAMYFAVLTAQANGTGPTRWDATGRPAWRGFNVYWLVPDGTGTSTMYYAFGSADIAQGASMSELNADATSAVAHAVAATDADPVARNLLHFASMVDTTKDRVALRLVGLTASGNSTNQLSVEGDAYARN